MNLKELKESLKTDSIGKKIYFFRQINSTNEIAKNFANNGEEEGTIIIAETQTHGKGRLNRNWSSPIGGLYLSIILKPKLLPNYVSKLNLLTAIAVAKTINQFGLSPKIKWPNDVLINRKKICGILTEISTKENKIKYIIVGIGINVNIDINLLPRELQKTSTSVKNELGLEISIADLIIKLLNEFEKLYDIFKKGDFIYIRKEWKKFSSTFQKNVKVITKNEVIVGYAFDIDEAGALLIKNDKGIKRVISGDCIHLKE